MNLKSKLFGFGAAAVLSLSMASGAMAEEAQIDASAKLSPGTCALNVFQTAEGMSADFGDWKWDGDSYELQVSGSNEALITGGVKNHKYNGQCQIGVKSDGLSSGSDSIAPNLINMTTISNTSYNVNLTANYQNGMFNSGPIQAKFTLTDVPNDVDTGTYEGDIDIQINNGM